jgi:MYXO-CTERM domain-containing protein
LDFDFQGTGDYLGAPATTETLVWYVHAPTGSVQVNVIHTTVTDSGSADVEALGFTTNFPGQHDLDVPAPGAAALLGLGGLAGIRRRRR